MWSYNRWRRRRILANCRISGQSWQDASARLRLLRGLSVENHARLRELAVLFLHEKTFEGAGGMNVTDSMRLAIGLQACLPILNLGLEWYQGWVSIVIYPGGFVPGHTYADEAGVVHTSHEPLSGESWLAGPVVLSWPSIESGAQDGYNLVIHEFAHKLDMLNGAANGMPPLHRGMDLKAWTRDFSQAFEDLRGRVARHEAGTPIDPYAAETPAEFFAVLSELFFEAPEVVRECYPAVYGQLRDFYRQDPASRMSRGQI
jgi:Mlc titration factor MtfA (ptsG expression regulator)